MPNKFVKVVSDTFLYIFGVQWAVLKARRQSEQLLIAGMDGDREKGSLFLAYGSAVTKALLYLSFVLDANFNTPFIHLLQV